jgi:hypothetical protein
MLCQKLKMYSRKDGAFRKDTGANVKELPMANVGTVGQ